MKTSRHPSADKVCWRMLGSITGSHQRPSGPPSGLAGTALPPRPLSPDIRPAPSSPPRRARWGKGGHYGGQGAAAVPDFSRSPHFPGSDSNPCVAGDVRCGTGETRFPPRRAATAGDTAAAAVSSVHGWHLATETGMGKKPQRHPNPSNLRGSQADRAEEHVKAKDAGAGFGTPGWRALPCHLPPPLTPQSPG